MPKKWSKNKDIFEANMYISGTNIIKDTQDMNILQIGSPFKKFEVYQPHTNNQK